MRKIISFTHATLDGYIDDPHKWSFQYSDEELQDYALKMTLAADALLLGRITYEGMAQAWPARGGNPFADHVNSITKYVVASQPVDTTAWDPTVVIAGPDLLDEVSRLKQAEGGDIVIWGTGQLTDALAAAGLLDEYRVCPCPVIKGGGEPLFRPAAPAPSSCSTPTSSPPAPSSTPTAPPRPPDPNRDTRRRARHERRDRALLAGEERQRALDAPLEHLISELSVSKRAGELQRADQQREEAERLPARGLGIAGGQAGGDLVGQSQDPLGVGVPGGIAAAPDLVEQRCGRAAVLQVVPVLDREVLAHQLLDSHAVRRLSAVALALLAQLVGDRRGDEVLLRCEVGVEGAVGQPRVRHQRRDAGAVDAVTLQTLTGGLDDPPPGRFLVFLAVPGHTPSSCPTTHCLLSETDYSTIIIQ